MTMQPRAGADGVGRVMTGGPRFFRGGLNYSLGGLASMVWIKSIALATWMLLVANTIAAGSDGSSPKTSDIAILTTTLSFLDLEHPERDMAKNVAHGDYRFIGINGYACTAPGIKGSHAKLISKYGKWCLEGTSDMIEGEEHMKLIKKARAYAERYNVALEKWLANREVP